MIKNWRAPFSLILLCALFVSARPTLAVDTLTGLTGMYDTRYYKYEVRGQSSVSVRLSQSLFEGGATRARIAIEKARLAGSRYNLADAAVSLVFDATAAHVNLERYNRLVELARQNVDDYRHIIDMLRSRVDNGLATEGDVSLVETRLLRAQATYSEYYSELLAAKADFEMVTGRPAPARIATTPFPTDVYASPAKTVEACLMRNPRLLAERENINMGKAQEKLAVSGFYPQFGVEAGPRWQTQNTPQDPANHGVDAFLTMRWNLYDGGATKASSRQAAAQTREARHSVNGVADALKSDIYGSWARYEAAGDRMKFYEKSMDTAERAKSVFHEQYLLGEKGLLDLLDADNEYFISACQFTVARADRLLGAYRLLALGGDLLSSLKVSPPETAKK